MGTDIQYFAETWIGGQWKPAFGDFHSTEDDQELSHRNKFYFGGDRSYELLEILADTIDPGSGHTLRGFQPISSPRGIPADVSPVIGSLAAEHGTYRHSWLLLRELIDFPWHTTFRKFAGYVNAENFALFKAGKPYQWDQLLPVPQKLILRGVKSAKFPLVDWQVISTQEMEDQIQIGGHHRMTDLQEALRRMELDQSREPVSDSLANLRTKIEFEESYAIPGHGILADTIPKLSTLGNPEHVRIVFWVSI